MLAHNAEVESLKLSLLQAISETRKRKSIESGGEGQYRDKLKILTVVNELEKVTENSNGNGNINLCANGKWNLIYSARLSSPSLSANPSFIDVISGNLYKIFFKFAPFLAGGSSSNSNIASSVVNEQYVDLDNKSVTNIVKFTIPNTQDKVTITVLGDAVALSKNELAVTFSSFNLKFKGIDVKLPLPRPKGSLKTTYCDADLRISRGGQGGLFIVKRLT